MKNQWLVFTVWVCWAVVACSAVGTPKAWSSEQDAELGGGLRLPQGHRREAPREDIVVFDPDFVDSLALPLPLRDYFLPAPVAREAPRKIGWFERDFAIFIEIFRFARQFIAELHHERDRHYLSVGDFRAAYVHKLPKYLPPGMYLQFEAFQTTVGNEGIVVRTEGGGAGLRVEFSPAPGGILTASLLPLYGERRAFNTGTTGLPGGQEFILRTSAAVAYRHKIGDRVEPGAQVFFQPQIIDFGQFRVYAELFVRLIVVNSRRSGFGEALRVERVSLVPKLVFWHSTDREGLFGDEVEKLLGQTYHQLGNNLYGFLNLEFHFRL